MFGAALLLVLQNLPRAISEQSEKVHETFGEVEWTTIFFFIGLFIVVYGVESTGLLEKLAHQALSLTGGDHGDHRHGDPVDICYRLRRRG